MAGRQLGLLDVDAREPGFDGDFRGIKRMPLALCRDGHDSVAFHGDRIARELQNALVATISVGAPRRFVLRPHARMLSDQGPCTARATCS